MSYAGYTKFLNNRCHYSFQTGEDTLCLVFTPTEAGKLSTKFSLSIPDPKGARTTDRLPLPDDLINEETASAIFAKAIGLFIDKKGAPLEKVSPLPAFSAPVKTPRQYIWAQHIQ